jgi:hypothetical protein
MLARVFGGLGSRMPEGGGMRVQAELGAHADARTPPIQSHARDHRKTVKFDWSLS